MLHTAPADQLVDPGHPDHPLASMQLDGVVVVTISGELDLYSAPQLRDTLRALLPAPPGLRSPSVMREQAPGSTPPARAVVVDLSEVSFMDSYALGILVLGHHLARPGGRGYALVATNPRIHDRFAVTGLVRVLPVHSDLPSALRGLSPRPPAPR